MLVMMSSVKLPSFIHTTLIRLIFPFCKDGAWQNKTARRPWHTLTQHFARLLTQGRIYGSGTELLLEKTTTYPATKWVTAAAGPAEAFLAVATGRLQGPEQ